ncbi:versiconal hemiacetal acetate reductase [Paracoccidioides brasiliensis]|nr:versiconal hemiacetal acetate reductase [Paracoccidioides brasiliensis]
MKSLNDVVESGKVRYIGVLLEEEHEMIPYCLDSGVGIIPRSPLARGVLPTPRSTKTSVHAHTDVPIGFTVPTRDQDVDEQIVVVWRSWRERRGSV